MLTASRTPAKGPHHMIGRSATPPRASLLEKASEFLEDKEIQAASNERKFHFLRTKGLTDKEINSLLATKNEVTEAGSVKDDGKGEGAISTANDVTTPPQPSNIDITDDYIDSQPSTEKEDRPPIITYPEFLLKVQKGPPLVTTGHLVSAFYLASAAAATMHGLSKYIVEPMVGSLTAARHSFFETVSGNINELNDKLGSMVSKIPDEIADAEERDGSDGGSVSSNSAHFFSRTIATQTSPRLSWSMSSASLTEKGTTSVVATHAGQMSKIHNLLSGLSHEESEASDPVKENLQLLAEYLNNLSMLGRIGQIRTTTEATQRPESWTDGIAKVKAEVKGVKGALLSARNFPAGTTSR